MKIGFVTCDESYLSKYFPTDAEPDLISPDPLFTPDDYLAACELRSHGHETHPVVWGTDPVMLQDYDLIIVRSPWDYSSNDLNKIKFFAWLDAVDQAGLTIANPPALMRWLLDKQYLRFFSACGIETIPTQYVDTGSPLDLKYILAAQGPYVLKQCISAGGTGLFFIDSEQAATQYQPEFDRLSQHSSYMVQTFVPEIISNGEWSLTFFGGRYSHSILKTTGKNSILIHAEHGGSLHFPVTPSDDVIVFANDVYRQIIPAFNMATGSICDEQHLLYMRIDIIETKSGPVLVECEGVEPELFFRARKGSEADFRRAIEDARFNLVR